MKTKLFRPLLRARGLPSRRLLSDASSALQRLLQAGASARPAPMPAWRNAAEPKRSGPQDRQVPGEFRWATFSGPAGSRRYRLYVPSGEPPAGGRPLLVMLHGCTQSPDDFAAGTRMNALGERQGCLVAYPEQTSAANMQRCWNWFEEGHQQRDRGEPALVAGLTREVMRLHAVDRSRVYVAGLSAGGAAAAVLGETYPDLYAAVGVHSGLACGAAGDVTSALAAMRGSGPQRVGPILPAGRRRVPTIVFHGERDTTVNPRNADAVVAQFTGGAALRTVVEDGQVPGGLGYRRTSFAEANGRTLVEQWVVRGAGHAWCGGSAEGSYTEPRGPDASAEMLRFFLDQPLVAAAE